MSAADVMREAWAEYHMLRADRFGNKVFDVMLDALRAAAGGADQVVIRWETTTCPRCLGIGADRQFNCDLCDGSGRGPETVTLHPVVQTSHEVGYAVQQHYVLVPVDTSVSAEPKEKP